MKKLIKSYDFKTNEQYYDYIVESLINGQRHQTISLVKELPKANKKECLMYFISDYEISDNVKTIVNELINQL